MNMEQAPSTFENAKEPEKEHEEMTSVEAIEERPLFTESDIEKWKESAKRYAELSPFLEKKYLEERIADTASLLGKFLGSYFQDKETSKLESDLESEYQAKVAPIQALFLGERAVALMDEPVLPKEREILEKNGFEVGTKWIYQKEKVIEAIERYEKEFGPLPNNDPELFIHAMQQISPEMAKEYDLDYHAIVGTLCGYPSESVKKFSEYIKKEELASLENNTRVHIHGIAWSEFKYDEEGEKIKDRLAAAFEKSGILETRRSKF